MKASVALLALAFGFAVGAPTSTVRTVSKWDARWSGSQADLQRRLRNKSYSCGPGFTGQLIRCRIKEQGFNPGPRNQTLTWACGGREGCESCWMDDGPRTSYSCHEMPVVTNYKDMMPGRCFQQYGVAAECKKVYDDCCSEKEIAPWEVKECVQAKLPGRKNPDASSEAYPEDAWLSSEDPDSPASSGTTTEHEWLFPDDSTSPASSKSKSSDTWVFPDDPRLRASSEWDTERWMLRRGSQSPTNDKDDLEAPFVFPSDSDYPGMRKTKANDIKMIQRDSGSSPVVEEDPERPFVFPDERDYPDLRKTNAKDKQVFSRNPQALDSSKDDLEQPFVFPSESDYPGMGETSRKAKKPQSSKIARSATPQMRDIWQNCVVGIKGETEAFECMGVMEFDLCALTTWSTEDCRKAILDCYRLSKGSKVRYDVGEKEFMEIHTCGAKRLAFEPDSLRPFVSTEAAELFAH